MFSSKACNRVKNFTTTTAAKSPMIYFHLSDSWEAEHQPQWVSWLHTLEQSDLSCAIVWVHSECLCIVHGLFHIKRKLTEKEQVRLSAHTYHGNSFKVLISPVLSVKLFWAVRFVSSSKAAYRYCGQYVDGNSVTAELVDFLNSQKTSE